MIVNDLIFSLLDIFEGCKLTAYKDTGGVWTIGFGHTGPEVIEGLVWTQDQAKAQLSKDTSLLLKVVSQKSNLSIAAQAAYVDFGYNCGIGSLAKVFSGIDQISNPKYCHDMHGNVLSYLQKRRSLEELLIQL
jgi:lysozyme